MESGKLKYCIITNEVLNDSTKSNLISVGLYQWLNVFDGQVLRASDILLRLKDGDIDIIHIRLVRENLPLVDEVRKKVGKNSLTKLVVSVDIPPQSWQTCGLDKNDLRHAVMKADFVFGTEYRITQALEQLAGKTVYELPYPADIDKLKKAGSNEGKQNYVSVLGNIRNRSQWQVISRFAGLFKLKIRKIRYHEIDYEESHDFMKSDNGIEFVNCNNDEEFCARINESKFVISLYEFNNYGKEVIYAAALGCLVFGYYNLDVIRRCFPYTSMKHLRYKDLAAYYYWFKVDPSAFDYLLQNVRFRVEYYNWGNSRKRFLDALLLETKDNRFLYQKKVDGHDTNLIVFTDEIKHVSGKRHVQCTAEEFAVVCLVRDGMDYLSAFLPYYRSLGAKHFYFIDNGSVDGTKECLEDIEDVTVYETKLLHKEYENEIRRTIIEEHCRQAWCLCVDIDEFFDYPFSDRISMLQFLSYLNKNRYTAVIAYMLDMFPRELQFENGNSKENFLKSCCYYDISKIKKADYFRNAEIEAYTGFNKLADKKMKNLYGGIREKKFHNTKNQYVLTKHPLTFGDHKIHPATTPHYCNKAFVADVNGVLKHYKFLPTFRKKVMELVESNTHMFFTDREYKAYYEVIKNQNHLDLFSSKAKSYNLQALINEGFIRISGKYKNYIANLNN